MTQRTLPNLVSLALLLGLAAGSSSPALASDSAPVGLAPTPAPDRWIEPRAEQLLRAMSERLRQASRFAFEAEETYDEIPDGEPRRSLSNLRRVAVQRPDRLAADVTGDSANRSFWYDGKTITILDKPRNVYMQAEALSTIDATLDMAIERLRLVVPLADLVYADPAAVLLEGVTYGRYLGVHRAAGVPCHHLVFAQAEIEWQIWIDAGADPVPRRLAITYVKEPGEPEYAATIVKWNFEPRFGDAIFHFEAPPRAKRITPARAASAPPAPEPPSTPAAAVTPERGAQGGKQ